MTLDLLDVSTRLDQIKLRAVAVAMMAGQLQHMTFTDDQAAALEFAADEVADMLAGLLTAVQCSITEERECSRTMEHSTAPA